MKRFKPKGEQRLGQLIVKFGQLMMTAAETLPEFTDRIRDCVAEIRACDPSQVPTDEQVAIRARAGIEFSFPYLYAALQVGPKRSLEELFKLLDAHTEKNQLVADGVNETPALSQPGRPVEENIIPVVNIVNENKHYNSTARESISQNKGKGQEKMAQED